MNQPNVAPLDSTTALTHPQALRERVQNVKQQIASMPIAFQEFVILKDAVDTFADALLQLIPATMPAERAPEDGGESVRQMCEHVIMIQGVVWRCGLAHGHDGYHDIRNVTIAAESPSASNPHAAARGQDGETKRVERWATELDTWLHVFEKEQHAIDYCSSYPRARSFRLVEIRDTETIADVRSYEGQLEETRRDLKAARTAVATLQSHSDKVEAFARKKEEQCNRLSAELAALRQRSEKAETTGAVEGRVIEWVTALGGQRSYRIDTKVRAADWDIGTPVTVIPGGAPHGD